MSKFNEKAWQAMEDANTLARYEEIMRDQKRKLAAIKEARKQADNLEKRANAMKAAGGRLRKK